MSTGQKMMIEQMYLSKEIPPAFFYEWIRNTYDVPHYRSLNQEQATEVIDKLLNDKIN